MMLDRGVNGGSRCELEIAEDTIARNRRDVFKMLSFDRFWKSIYYTLETKNINFRNTTESRHNLFKYDLPMIAKYTGTCVAISDKAYTRT